MNHTTVILSGRDYAIRPLTLGQLRVVLPAFARAAESRLIRIRWRSNRHC